MMEGKIFFRTLIGIFAIFSVFLTSCYESSENISATEDSFKIIKQDLVGTSFPVVNKEYNQQNPSAIFLPDENLWFVVWEDWRNGDADIYGQFVKSDGSLCGTEFQINTPSTQNQTVPSVAYDPVRKNIAVVWQDSRKVALGGYVFLKRLNISSLDSNCSGYVLGTEYAIGYLRIDGDSLLSRQKPKIKYDPVNDRYLVAWIEKRDKLPYTQCFGRKVTSDDLSPLYIGYAIINSATFSVPVVDIIRNDNNSYAIRGREVSATFSSLIETHTLEIFKNIGNVDIDIDSTSNEQIFVFDAERYKAKFTCECIDSSPINNVCDPSESISVKLNVTGFTIGEENSKHIYGIFYNNISLRGNPAIWIDSDPINAEESINIYPSSNPSLTFDPISKRFLVTWENEGKDGNSKIYGQLIYSGVGKYNKNFLISYQDLDGNGKQDSVVANSKQTDPYASYDAVNQRFFVAWQDARNGSESIENLDIYGQYVDLDGTLRGNNYFINTDDFNQLNPVISFNTITNQYLAVWKDARNATKNDCGSGSEPCGSDIYGQRFTLGQPQLTLLRMDNSYLAPAIIDFGSVIKDQKAIKSFKIKNTGDSELKIDCIDKTSLSSIFSFESLPPKLSACDNDYLSLNPGTSIEVSLTFVPVDTKVYSGKFTVKSNGGNRTVFVQGNGVENLLLSGIEISEDSGDGNVGDSIIDFKDVLVGSEKQRSVTLTNKTDRNIKVSISGATDPFSIASIVYPPSDIMETIPPNSTAIINLSFHPETRGIYERNMYISVNLPDVKPFTLTLKGTGVAPVLGVEPSSLDFGTVNLGSFKTLNIKIKNNGDGKLIVNSCGSIPEGFSYTNCPHEVGAGDEETLSINFSPTEPKEYTGTIEIDTNAGTKTVSLKGSGKGGLLVLSNEIIDFQTQYINTTKTINLEIRNEGNAEFKINQITNPFLNIFKVKYTGSLPITVLPNTSYTISVEFDPTQEGFYTDFFEIKTDTAGNKIVRLQGKAVKPSIIIYQPSSLDFGGTLDFGEVQVNAEKTKTIRLKNESLTDITLKKIDNPLDPFSVSSQISLPKTIAPGETLDIDITFKPTGSGKFSTSIGLLFDDSVDPKIIRLEGTGAGETGTVTPGSISFNPKQIIFGKVFIGESKEQIVKIKNEGSQDINITNVSITDNINFYIVGLKTPFILEPNEEKEFKVKFIPNTVSNYSATLSLKDENDNVYQLSITGIGYPVKVSTNKGTVADYQLLGVIPYPNNVPRDIGGKLIVHKVISFVIDTGDYSTANQEVDVTVVVDRLPKNATYYKVNSSTGEWIELTGLKIDGNKISYTLKDNSNIDSDNRIGYIEDPLIIGTVQTTSVGSESGTTNPPPNLGGGSSGCSLSKNIDYSLLLMGIIPIGFLVIRRVKMKKAVFGLLIVSIIFLNGCGGSGDGSDVGTSVTVDSSVGQSYVDVDLLFHDPGPDDECGTDDDVFNLIPAAETVTVNFFAHPISDSIPMSPVKVKEVEIIYTPKSGTLTPRVDYQTLGYEFSETGSLEVPVMTKEMKSEINSAGESGEYYVIMKFKLNEINYDNDLETRIGLTIDVHDQLQEDECP